MPKHNCHQCLKQFECKYPERCRCLDMLDLVMKPPTMQSNVIGSNGLPAASTDDLPDTKPLLQRLKGVRITQAKFCGAKCYATAARE